MYGLQSFDGQLSLNESNWESYWSDIKRRSTFNELTGRAGLNWNFWNGQFYEIERYLRLDLLGIANVQFILSALPLESDQLQLVEGPESSERILRRPGEFTSIGKFFWYRVKRVFDPEIIYISHKFHARQGICCPVCDIRI